MGEFSKLERQILVDISKLKYDKANVMELIGKNTLIEAALSWNVEEDLFELFVPIDKKEWIGEFFETLCFIETLEREGLIYLHKNYEAILTRIDFQSYGLEQNYVNANMSKFGIQKVKTDLFEKIKRFGKK